MAGGAAATRRRRSENGKDVLKLQGQQIRRICAMLDALLEVAPAGIANAMRNKLNGSKKSTKKRDRARSKSRDSSVSSTGSRGRARSRDASGKAGRNRSVSFASDASDNSGCKARKQAQKQEWEKDRDTKVVGIEEAEPLSAQQAVIQTKLLHNRCILH